jgi:hypothetical protein
VRSRPGAARTILLFHIISARPSKQRMVGSTLGVYSFWLIFVSARTNKRHHHHFCIDLACRTCHRYCGSLCCCRSRCSGSRRKHARAVSECLRTQTVLSNKRGAPPPKTCTSWHTIGAKRTTFPTANSRCRRTTARERVCVLFIGTQFSILYTSRR